MEKMNLEGELIIEQRKIFNPKGVYTVAATESDLAYFKTVDNKNWIEKILNNPSPKIYDAKFFASLMNAQNPDQCKVENKFCKEMPIEFARKHLEPLKSNTRLNKDPYLTEEDFELFITNAFIKGNKNKKVKVNTTGRRGKLYKIIHQFYKAAVIEGYEENGNCLVNYENLITGNFLGFKTSQVKGNLKS